MNFTIETKRDNERAVDYITKLPEGKRFSVTVGLKREKRSFDQNRLYWLWLACITDETGNEKDELHKYFAGKFIGVKEVKVFDSIQTEVISTTTLNTKGFTDYLERVRAFAASELGITLPDPEDKYWEEFYDKYKDFI